MEESQPTIGIHEPREPDMGEAAHGERFGFAGHDAELMAACVTASHRVDDTIVAADQPIVVRELVFAVGGDEGGLVRRRRGRIGRTS